MPFRISFRGLISHIQNGSDEARAVMVLARGHRPLIVVHEDYIHDIEGWPNNPIGGFHILDLSSELVLDQAKIDLTKPPQRTAEFKKHVPSLTVLLADKIDDDAKKGKTAHVGVAASLRYGTGFLTATHCFPVAAKWSSDPDKLPECVAREVMYIAEPDGTVVIHDGDNSHRAFLEKNAMIWVTNSDKGNQFKELAKLGIGKGATLISEPSEDAATCDDCRRNPMVQPNGSLECSNTGYP